MPENDTEFNVKQGDKVYKVVHVIGNDGQQRVEIKDDKGEKVPEESIKIDPRVKPKS